jgi:hypothetical protein
LSIGLLARYLNEIRSAKENRRSTKSNTAVKFGGLDWNRTSDTRIFNCNARQKPSIYGVVKEKRVTCDISCYSQITEYRITFLFYQREKTCQVQQFLATAGAVKNLMLFSAPANPKNI